MSKAEMKSAKAERSTKKETIHSVNIPKGNSVNKSNYRVIIFCVLGLTLCTSTCNAAVLQTRNTALKVPVYDKLSIISLLKNEPNEHDPPVTSSDLPKQIPAPPRPHFASTPHYEQQLARFVWVTPQYNTPSYPIVNQV